MNNLNLNSKRVFTLLPNGFFFSNWGNSYFCGRYQGDCPPSPIEVVLNFPFEDLFVCFTDNVLKVNLDRYPYRYSTASTPALPLYLGGESHENLGRFENLDYLLIDRGVLSANGVVMPLRDFPLDRFELSPVDLARANQFLALGYTKVGFVYAWYKPIVFVSFGKPWSTFYLRVGCRLGIERA